MSEARFSSWSAAESPVTVEYSLVAIEEIRHEVAEGFQRLSRGGVDVGGVLYGTREGRTVRILAMRPIACEHAHGPVFQLSDADRELLQEQLEHDIEDPRLSEMICVGWFVSHTRSGIVLSEVDQEIFSRYFGAPWQVTLIVRPSRGGVMRAGFFVREHDGTVHAEASYQEFDFPDRLAGVLERSGRTRESSRDASRTRAVTRTRLPHVREEGVGEAVAREAGPAEDTTEEPAVRNGSIVPAAPQHSQNSLIPAPQFLPPTPPRPKWPWLALWILVVLVAAGVGVRYWLTSPHSEPLGLGVAERNGQLQIEWNHSARPIPFASGGSLTIADGPVPQVILLSRENLEQGSFAYKRVSDNVVVHLTIETAGGGRFTETTTFLGPPPAATDNSNVKQVEQERDDLKTENDRLTKQNASQAKRIQQLERSMKVLETRLGIPATPAPATPAPAAPTPPTPAP